MTNRRIKDAVALAISSPGQDVSCVGPHPDLRGLDWSDGEVRLHVAGDLQAKLAWSLPGTREGLAHLLGEGLACAEWEEMVAAAPDGGVELGGLLQRLARGRLLAWWYGTPARRLLIAEALTGGFLPGPLPKLAETAPQRRLSDKAAILLAREEPRLVDPLAEAQIVVRPEGLGLLPLLMSATRRAPGTTALPEGLADFLERCGFLRAEGEESPFVGAWTPAEWLFQRQTGFVSGFRFEQGLTGERQVPRPAPRRAAAPDLQIALPRPVDGRSAPLAEVMERRCSLRQPSSRPLTRAQLATLLWRVARRREDRESLASGDLVLRNVPAGGALGELEFYLAVNRCEGLERGFYFYDGKAHALAPVAKPGPAFDALLEEAAQRLFIGDARPDCLLVLGSRLARLSQKYRGGALRLSLLHVGLVFEALYLAATDLGLSPCATGFSNCGHFAALTGYDPFDELSLGEFALSGPPD